MAVSEEEKRKAREARSKLRAQIEADAVADQEHTQKILNRELSPEEMEDNEGAIFDDDDDEDADEDLLTGGDGPVDDEYQGDDDQSGGDGAADESEADGEDADGEGVASPKQISARSVDELNKLTDEDLWAYHKTIVGRDPTQGTKRPKVTSNIIQGLDARDKAEKALKKE